MTHVVLTTRMVIQHRLIQKALVVKLRQRNSWKMRVVFILLCQNTGSVMSKWRVCLVILKSSQASTLINSNPIQLELLNRMLVSLPLKRGLLLRRCLMAVGVPLERLMQLLVFHWTKRLISVLVQVIRTMVLIGQVSVLVNGPVLARVVLVNSPLLTTVRCGTSIHS